ncbi:hypothetical protein ACWGHM_37190 [Streptomyces sp. NPDC054904]
MSTDISGMIECRPGARLWGPDDEDSVWEVGIDLFLLNRGNAYDGLIRCLKRYVARELYRHIRPPAITIAAPAA